MYFITTMEEMNDWGGSGLRCFGYFDTLEEAQKAVSENRHDMHETCYHYLLIEAISVGIHPNAEKVQWYTFDVANDKWVAIPEPEQSKHTCNYALG